MVVVRPRGSSEGRRRNWRDRHVLHDEPGVRCRRLGGPRSAWTIRDLEGPFCKRFPLDEPRESHAAIRSCWVAVDGERIVGFAAIRVRALERSIDPWHCMWIQRAGGGALPVGPLKQSRITAANEGRATSGWKPARSPPRGIGRLPRLGLLPDRRRPDLVRGDAGARRTALFFSRRLDRSLLYV